MLVDTNVIIACLNAEPKATVALSEWKRGGQVLCISPITIAETLSIPALTDAEVERIHAFLRSFISISFDDAIAEVAAALRRKYRLEIPDAGIAATALTREMPVVTRDRQFRKIQEITVIAI